MVAIVVVHVDIVDCILKENVKLVRAEMTASFQLVNVVRLRTKHANQHKPTQTNQLDASKSQATNLHRSPIQITNSRAMQHKAKIHKSSTVFAARVISNRMSPESEHQRRLPSANPNRVGAGHKS